LFVYATSVTSHLAVDAAHTIKNFIITIIITIFLRPFFPDSVYVKSV
jgi:hypothetical protein